MNRRSGYNHMREGVLVKEWYYAIGGGFVFKQNTLIVLIAIFVLGIGMPVYAGHFDFNLFGSRHSVDACIDIGDLDVVALIRSQGNRQVVSIDSQSNMTNIGDFKLEENKRSYSEVGIGYKLGPITPFVGYATRAVFSVKQTVIKNELTGKNEIISKSCKEANAGLSLGLYFEQRLDDISIGITIATDFGDVYGEARTRYYINDHLALLGGYVYHPSVNTTGAVVGMGITY